MAVFDLSSMNKGTRKAGSAYGVLVDQLSILESQLSGDGKLSPGDYQVLQTLAMKLYANPGLTPNERSNFDVKIAGYKSASSKSKVKDNQDISMINTSLNDDERKASMLYGNDPVKFLQAQAAIQSDKVERLSDAIDLLDNSDGDSSTHLNEYNNALIDYKDTLAAFDYMQKHQAGVAPSSGFAAYIQTNNKGEIQDVKITREGQGPSGKYYETNGLYGGLKIYGLMNKKENGNNVFLLGSKTFSAVDAFIPSPDGTMKTNVLADTSTQRGGSVFQTAPSSYTEVTPDIMTTQKTIRNGDYVQGSGGFIYKKNDDGTTYTKYLKAPPEATNLFKIPKVLEQSIIPNVTSTITGMEAPTMPAPISFGTASSTAPAPVSSTTEPVAGGRPGPSVPTERAPSSSQGIASKVLGAAKGFFGRLFSGGQ